MSNHEHMYIWNDTFLSSSSSTPGIEKWSSPFDASTLLIHSSRMQWIKHADRSGSKEFVHPKVLIRIGYRHAWNHSVFGRGSIEIIPGLVFVWQRVWLWLCFRQPKVKPALMCLVASRRLFSLTPPDRQVDAEDTFSIARFSCFCLQDIDLCFLHNLS